ncbi:sulfatase [Natronosalvus vescus]|uniref:sulfatase n=1 Tax=Natronosalvus vescus TaxID=2953881 RepID=UPI002091E10B|nr:sulfatase [Natronosalvus vescus]
MSAGESNGRDVQTHQTAPNVVFVVLDTARKASVSRETMPTLARLGEAGTTFERAFATAPWTVPSHAAMFTGTYTAEHGTHGGHTYLDSSLRTLPEAFLDAGYETVGVTNNTWITDEFGFDRGFDDLRRGWQYIQSDVDMGTVVRGEDLREKLEATRGRLFDGNPLINLANVLYSEVLQPTGDDGADRSTDWMVDWLHKRSDDRPFFLFCNYIEPHIAYDPPSEFAEHFLPDDWDVEEAMAIRQDPRAFDCEDYELTESEFAALHGLYRAELAYVDSQLARLSSGLENAGLWEDTLLVVCGDHGENIGDHGFFGHQYNLYDTVLHVPLLIHGGPFTGGGTRTDLVQLLDLPNTLLEAVGIDDPAFESQSDGRSLVTADRSQRERKREREAVYAEYVSPQPSIERLEDRFGTLPEHVYTYDRRLQSIRTDRYKYVRGDGGFERLHDLERDPTEATNIATKRPEKADRLRRQLESHFDGLEGVNSPATAKSPPEMREGTKERLADLGYL